jgi:hypothetical protein
VWVDFKICLLFNLSMWLFYISIMVFSSYSLGYILKSSSIVPAPFFFLLRIPFIHQVFCVSMWIWGLRQFPISAKNIIYILIRISSNLFITLDIVDISTLLIIICEHGLHFHLCVCMFCLQFLSSVFIVFIC